MNMKTLGIIMIIVAVAVILYNVAISKENERTAAESPWTTVLSGGANLKPCYTFTPPYTGFEIFIFAIGGLGVIFLFLPNKDKGE